MTYDEETFNHSEKAYVMMKNLVEHLRSEVQKVDDPEVKAIFETSAVVITRLMRSIRELKNRTEPALKN